MPYSDSFKKLLKKTKENYLYKDVPKKYRGKYGEKYDSKEIESIAFAIAKSRGIKIEK